MIVPMAVSNPQAVITSVKRGERYGVLATDVINGGPAAWVEHIDKETLRFATSDGTSVTGSDFDVREAFKTWFKAIQAELEKD